MGTVLCVYSHLAFKEYLLPAVNNADHSLILSADLFNLPQDLILSMEIIDESWKILPDESFILSYTRDGRPYSRERLSDGDVMSLSLLGGNQLSVVVKKSQDVLGVFEKFSIEEDEEITIGKNPDNTFSYDALNLVSRQHAIIKASKGKCIIEDHSSNGTFVNNKRIYGSKQLDFGDRIDIFGLRLVYLGDILAVKTFIPGLTFSKSAVKNTDIHSDATIDTKVFRKDGLFHRSPRLVPKIHADGIKIEAPPQNVVFFAMMSEREELKDNILASYRKYLEEIREQIKEKYERNKQSLLALYPSVGELCKYDSTNSQLWNRNLRHKDFLCHRLGIGDIPFQIPITIPGDSLFLADKELAGLPAKIRDEFKMLKGVPVCVDLMSHRLVGIVGDRFGRGCQEVLLNIIAGIAAGNSYTDVKLVIIRDENFNTPEEAWEFARWLPHLWSEDRKVRYLASNHKEAAEILYEIVSVLRSRRDSSTCIPHYVLVVENPALLEEELISKYVFDENVEDGLSTIILAGDYGELPNECEYIVENTSDFSGMYNVSDGVEDRIPIEFDAVTPEALEEFARRICGIRIPERDLSTDVPEYVTLFDLYNIREPKGYDILQNWKKNRTYESIRVCIGKKAGGRNLFLDVHEKYHGPHGLLAGTTGSGKSELLQTFMLSLAMNYSPEDVAFFIIDYKGGGMATPFEKLPHMQGMISNLSGSRIRRALISIKSENIRRQKIFSAHGVNNINLYSRLYKSGEATEPIPHLFIIVDEFAQLKVQEPEFMNELISVAQVGRSLGIHLVLSTQKPGGTVDDNIWSNARFRLCLRVSHRQDSMDMLHHPEAAFITQTGRGYLQVGNDEINELFQTAYSGAMAEDSGQGACREIAVMLETDGSPGVYGYDKRKSAGEGIRSQSQLEAILKYIAEIGADEGYSHSRKLWLDPLGDRVYLQDLEPEGVAVGLVDDPYNQSQMTLSIDLDKYGHHAILGMPQSGKSTLLQTSVYSLIQTYTPEQIHIYCIDYSGKSLGIFESAPHVGGVVLPGQEDKLDKLFAMITTMHEDRKQEALEGLPRIVLIIDELGSLREKAGNKHDEAINLLLKEGGRTGIYLITTAAGFSINEIPSRMAENFRRVLCLEMPDKFAYQMALGVNRIDVLPEENVRGRGLIRQVDRVLEFQTALAVTKEDAQQRDLAIKSGMDELGQNYVGPRVPQIPQIPKTPIWSDFIQEAKSHGLTEGNDSIPIGYDMKSAEIYCLPLSRIHSFMVSGGPGLGKTNLLKCILSACGQAGEDTWVVDFNGEFSQEARNSKSRYIGERGELRTLLEGDNNTSIKPTVIVGDFVEFLKAMEELGLFKKELLESFRWFYGFDQEDRLEAMTCKGYRHFVRGSEGIHLGGAVESQRALSFEHLTYAQRGRVLPAGTGMLATHDYDDTQTLVVPLYDKS